MAHRYDVPPSPPDAADCARWDESRRRRRMLSGRWAYDLEQRLRAHFGLVARVAIGPKSLAKNQLRKLCNDLAVNYDQVPLARHTAGERPAMFGRAGLCTRVGLWPMLRRLQVNLIGLRQMFLRPDWSYEIDQPVARLVNPDTVVVRAFASAPLVPVEIRELRWRDLPDGRGMWAWDWISIADPDKPFYRVVEAKLDGKDGEDVTRTVLGGKEARRFEDGDYPYRWTQGPRQGQPFLPYSAYHAMRKESFWDPYEGLEVVEGSLDIATAHTFVLHTMFKASYPLRYGVGVIVPGAVPIQTSFGPRTEIPTGPNALLHLASDGTLQTPIIGQWGAGADPEMLARTTSMLERAVADFDGNDSAHVVRDTANPWSAAALSISREGKRAAQQRYSPELQPSDLETLEKLAAIANLSGWSTEPLDEFGYMLDYKRLPLSSDELNTKRTHNGEMIASGRMSVVDAHQDEHPGMERDEAVVDLDRIHEDNERFGVRPGTAPTALATGRSTEGKGAALPAPAAGAEKAADTALNGAQVQAAQAIVVSVARRELPREAGVAQLVAFFNLTADVAERLMGEVGKSFFIEAPPPTTKPAADDAAATGT